MHCIFLLCMLVVLKQVAMSFAVRWRKWICMDQCRRKPPSLGFERQLPKQFSFVFFPCHSWDMNNDEGVNNGRGSPWWASTLVSIIYSEWGWIDLKSPFTHEDPGPPSCPKASSFSWAASMRRAGLLRRHTLLMLAEKPPELKQMSVCHSSGVLFPQLLSATVSLAIPTRDSNAVWVKKILQNRWGVVKMWFGLHSLPNLMQPQCNLMWEKNNTYYRLQSLLPRHKLLAENGYFLKWFLSVMQLVSFFPAIRFQGTLKREATVCRKMSTRISFTTFSSSRVGWRIILYHQNSQTVQELVCKMHGDGQWVRSRAQDLSVY